ncbi:MAG: aconitate hydratase [Candidatus Melainabacteria bacterium]|nr:aconitate hydratase [Candidatus Melainabacteria bacterium]
MTKFSKKQFEDFYASRAKKYTDARKKLNRPLTLAEKILTAHLDHWPEGELVRGETYAFLRPDRVAMQDATAQMALLQFMQARIDKVAVPTTVHCDHLIQARVGVEADMKQALNDNQEVYDFLRTASAKHGIGFWKPNSGIIHQVVLEQYAFPGGMMIGTDSHTPNAGGLCMIAIGVGGADAVDVMVGEAWGVRWPKLIGVHLKGKLNGWASPKDIILKVAGILTVAGGTGAIVEYFGEGTKSISATGKATITNMGAELGATTSVFPYDDRSAKYLAASGRQDLAEMANTAIDYLRPDPEVLQEPEKYFDKLIEIDLDELEPYVVGPHSPDVARPISQMAQDVKEKDYPEELKFALIGSCTNSSYEDMSRAASIARQASANGLSATCGLMVTPGSEQVYATIKRDGQIEDLEKIGATVLANACGPCIGQWKRDDIKSGDRNSILTSFNRNFQKRNDGNAETLAFISSPELVIAMSLSGKLTFNPLKDTITAKDGKQVKLAPPEGLELPTQGFVSDVTGFIEPPKDGRDVEVAVAPDSNRLQLLEPFAPWDGKDIENLPILLKARGKCTTDHISPAGEWLKFRGHLDKISNNMFITAQDDFCEKSGKCFDVFTKEEGNIPEVARHYKQENQPWVVIGDTNYGEGSSREHAAMSPRFLGCKAVIVRSFARIHETNLKKQGILPFTFDNPADYLKIKLYDRVSIKGLHQLEPETPVTMTITHIDGSTEDIVLNQTMTQEQIEWFKEGSALNLIKKRRQEELAHA